MHFGLYFSFFLLLCLQGGLAAQTLSPSDIEPGAFAKLLSENKQNNRQTFAAQLLSAERAFENRAYDEALIYYDKAATLGAPNSRWYLGKSALYTKLGKDAEAFQVIKDGKEVYPFSNRLALAYARNTVLKKGTPTTEEVEELDLPPMAKVQLNALIAFKQKDLVKGLLETERAHYLAPEELLDQELSNQYLQALFNFSVAYLDDDQVKSPSYISYPEGSFENLYLKSTESAVRAYNTHHANEIPEGVLALVRLADIRTSSLRDFVKKGHLGRFQDPMLVDLYILDDANHLRGATLLMYMNSIGQITSFDTEAIAPYLNEMAAAQQYMDTKWGADVDEFLARF